MILSFVYIFSLNNSKHNHNNKHLNSNNQAKRNKVHLLQHRPQVKQPPMLPWPLATTICFPIMELRHRGCVRVARWTWWGWPEPWPAGQLAWVWLLCHQNIIGMQHNFFKNIKLNMYLHTRPKLRLGIPYKWCFSFPFSKSCFFFHHAI